MSSEGQDTARLQSRLSRLFLIKRCASNDDEKLVCSWNVPCPKQHRGVRGGGFGDSLHTGRPETMAQGVCVWKSKRSEAWEVRALTKNRHSSSPRLSRSVVTCIAQRYRSGAEMIIAGR